MAPSAVETINVPETVDIKKLTATLKGDYKEIAPLKYNKDTELAGTDGHEAANVRSNCFFKTDC